MILTFSKEKITLALAKVVKVGNNNATTKQLTAQPSRHTMAIFMPNTYQTVLSTGVNTTVFHNFAPCKIMRIVGLITQNTIPILGNMRSRLVAVVETQHHLFLNGKSTKQLGAFIMLKTYLLNSFYVFVSLIATSVFVCVVWFLLIVILGA